MKRIEIDDFCALKYPSRPEFSPDGKTLCFVLSEADKKKNAYSSYLYIRRGGKVRQLTSGGKESSFVWLDNDTLLFPGDRSGSTEPTVETKYYKISLSGGEASLAFTLPVPVEELIPLGKGEYLAVCTCFPGYEELYTGDKKLAEKYLADRKENEDYEVITQNPWWWNGAGFIRGAYSRLFRLSAKGKLSPVTPVGMGVSDVKLSPEKDRVYYSLVDQSVPVPKYNDGEDLFMTELVSMKSEHVISSSASFIISTCYPAPSGLIIAANDGHCGLCGGNDFYLLPYGEHEPRLYAAFNGEIGSSVGSDVRHGSGKAARLVGNTLYFISTEYDSAYLFKLENGAITKLIDKAGSADCFDISGDKLAMVALYDMRPPEVYDEKLRALTAFNKKALAGKYTAVPEKLEFVTAGHEVHGFVLKPLGFKAGKKYPVIIDIHGGPKTVYGPVFYHEMQYWAGLGYFVIFCNPTGSDGRGDFMDIRGKYGTVDFDDIMAFCDAALAAYPEMDADNFFETGGSYGGFMTNWIVGHTDRFRACASQRSISNWFSFMGVSDIGYGFGMDQTGGDIWASPEKVWEHSPLKYADRCKTPTLFIHSFEDYRCPIDQGYQMFAALANRGVETKLVAFKGENHELSRSGKPLHRIKRLDEITQWFEKHKG